MSNRTRVGNKKPSGLGFVINDIQREEKHLTIYQRDAALLLMAYMEATGGSSAGLVGRMADKVDCSTVQRSHPPGGGELDERWARLLRSLHKHELELITRIAHGRGGCLEQLGKVKSSFKANRTARAFAIGRVTALLDSVVELAQLKPELPPVPT